MQALPPVAEMYQALVTRDRAYDGIFVAAIRTTGIFCRPTCSAKKPRAHNVEYYSSVRDALSAGFRPCKRCRPLELNGHTPAWLSPLLDAVERDPAKRWTDADLRRMDLDPTRVRRWFRAHHDMTFHAFQRARRLGRALGQLRQGSDLSQSAFDSGFESLSGFRDAFAQMFGSPPGQAGHATAVLVTRLLTPLGPMVAGATAEGVCLLEFADRRMLQTQVTRLRRWLDATMVPGDHQHIQQLDEEISEYFAGRRRAFSVPLVMPGTGFQKDAWRALLEIPYGCTRSYAEQARAAGRPGAVRAVGRANGDNRLAIVIPCHRVVRSDGTLCGYGGGLRRKEFLLEHERAYAANGTSRRTAVPS